MHELMRHCSVEEPGLERARCEIEISSWIPRARRSADVLSQDVDLVLAIQTRSEELYDSRFVARDRLPNLRYPDRVVDHLRPGACRAEGDHDGRGHHGSVTVRATLQPRRRARCAGQYPSHSGAYSPRLRPWERGCLPPGSGRWRR